MISIILRSLLILVSVWLFFYVLRSVRKAQVQIDDMIFWLVFSVVMVILAAVPQIALWAANLFGVQSPINLIYLVIIFVLLLKSFNMSVKYSQMETKMKALTQAIAIREHLREETGAEPAAGGKAETAPDQAEE